jgi:hypothetical protein
MKRAVAALLLSGAASACGAGSPPRSLLTLAGRYWIAGGGRLLPDGVTPSGLAPISLVLQIEVAGGEASGQLARRPGGAPSAIQGGWDAASGELSIAPFSGATLTGTAAEDVLQLGATGQDGIPADALADELDGYLRTARGAQVFDGAWIAVADQPARPPLPDLSKIGAVAAPLGQARIQGRAGAVAEGAAVGVFAFSERSRDPSPTLGQANSDGSFDFMVDAVIGDLLLVRAQQGGRPGDAVSLTVTR